MHHKNAVITFSNITRMKKHTLTSLQPVQVPEDFRVEEEGCITQMYSLALFLLYKQLFECYVAMLFDSIVEVS